MKTRTSWRKRRDACARRFQSARWMAIGAMAVYAATGGRSAAIGYADMERAESAPSPAGALPVRRFDIADGPLDAVLAAYRTTSGLTVLLRQDAIGSLPSPGVTGDYTPEQALKLLLSGTGVSYRFSGDTTVALELRMHETVEVTAAARPASPKYTATLRDIPQTITVIPKALMQEQGATALRDVLRNVPGITIQAGEGGVPAGDNLTIRGFSARTDMFVDGVRDFGGYSRDAFNMEQVEVTKGPASAIVGRGSTGGAINMVSKAPGLQATRSADLAGGNAAYKRGTIDVNQPVESVPGMALRLNALWQNSDVPGRTAVENDRWGLAPSLSLGLGGKTQATLGYFRLDQDNLPDYGLPWVPATNTNPALLPYSGEAPPVDYDNFYGLTARDYEKTATDLGTLTLRRDLGPKAFVRNLARYGRTQRDSVITAPRFATTTGTDINRQLQSRDQTDSIASDQLDFNVGFGTGKVQHALVAGAEISHEIEENFLRAGPTAPLADLYRPDPSQPYPGGIARTGAVNEGTADGVAVYAFDTLRIGSRWEVTGGARFDRFEVGYDQTAVTGVVTSFSRKDDLLSWRGGVIFKPRPSVSVYAGIGNSYNPSAEGLSLAATTVSLDPEKTRNYEVGTKWDLVGRKLAMNGALFRTEKTNARTPGINPGDPATVLQGEQIVNGLEFGLTGTLTRRWQAYAALSLMNSDIARTNAPTDLNNDLTLVPKTSFNFWSTIQLPHGIDVGGGVQFMDNVYRNTLNTTEAPGYWLVNATAAYEVNKKLTLRLTLNNLADKDFIDRVGGGHFIPGAGRQAFVNATVKF